MIRKSILIPFFIVQAVTLFFGYYYLVGDSFVSALVVTILFSAIYVVVGYRGLKKQQRKEDEEYANKWGMDVSDL
jgi:membrane protein implicated in regulation of membrane protease activity